MKKKLYTVAAFAFSLLTFTGCLDVEPVSDLTDQNMWQSEGTFEAFVVGVHNELRNDSWNMFCLGELRSDIYSTVSSAPLGSIASKSERYANNTLDEANPGMSNYAGLYKNINQINLFIHKALASEVLEGTKRDYYLGEMYGMRAFYYFHLLRSWNNVVWNDQPSLGFAVGNLDRPVTDAAQIMKNIKQDIESSLEKFGNDYSFFKGSKNYWSQAATLMLKAEVYLWSSRQMGGGEADARTALQALEAIRSNVPSLELEKNYKDVFAYANKCNKEIIFAVHYSESKDENQMFADNYRLNYCPDKGTLGNWYDKETGGKFDTTKDNFNGVGYYPLNDKLCEVFVENDTRGKATIKPFYSENWEYVGIIAYKYQGITLEGESVRKMCDDYPIYRYADLLLMIAEAKSLTGGDPTEEINAIRKRAYDKQYNEATLGYPNQPIDADVHEAILQERFCEFVLEGKRWYDLRRFGNDYVFKYTTANSQYPKRLIWPIDRDTMVKNPAIHQTDGYETLMN